VFAIVDTFQLVIEEAVVGAYTKIEMQEKLQDC
jgi:hypothetical protein